MGEIAGGLPAPSVSTAIRAFIATLGGKSPQTERTYRSGLKRFEEFLEEEGLPPGDVPTDALPATILERFHAWLVRGYTRDRRSTIVTYLAAARAFVAFLDRRGLLAQDVSSEQMRGHLREVVGKGSYRTPRIDRGLPLIVTHVKALPLPDAKQRKGARRLEVLRDRALIRTLLFTFARVSAATAIRVSDYYPIGERWWVRLQEKGGKHHEMPVHHTPADAVTRTPPRLILRRG